MVICHQCSEKYDARVHRQFCPTCKVVANHYKPGKGGTEIQRGLQDSDLDNSFSSMTELTEPTSPSIERDPSKVTQLIALEEEKKELLTRRNELIALDARLIAIRLENEALESEAAEAATAAKKAAMAAVEEAKKKNGGKVAKKKSDLEEKVTEGTDSTEGTDQKDPLPYPKDPVNYYTPPHVDMNIHGQGGHPHGGHFDYYGQWPGYHQGQPHMGHGVPRHQFYNSARQPYQYDYGPPRQQSTSPRQQFYSPRQQSPTQQYQYPSPGYGQGGGFTQQPCPDHERAYGSGYGPGQGQPWTSPDQHGNGCCGQQKDGITSKFDYRRFLPASERRKTLTIKCPSDLWYFHSKLLKDMLNGGCDVSGFLDHMEYLSEMSRSGVYEIQALVAYDEEMLERARIAGESAFQGADTHLTNTKLGAGSTRVVGGVYQGRGGQSGTHRGGNSNKNSNYVGQSGKDKFGDLVGWRKKAADKGICFKYSQNMLCEKCAFKHACINCDSIAHGMFDCKKGAGDNRA